MVSLTKPLTNNILHEGDDLQTVVSDLVTKVQSLIAFSTGAISGVFKVGNDPAAGPYDYSQLKDALSAITVMNSLNVLAGQATYRITIPAGFHSFNALRLRGVDLSNVQIWGSGSTNTEVQWTPTNTTDGNCWEMRYAHIGDIVGIKFTMAASVTSPTDKATVCQRWYGSGQEPWYPAKATNFFDIISSSIGRIADVVGLGVISGIRLGSFINCQNSTIYNLESASSQNMRDSYIFYNGSVVGGGYNGVTATQTYNFLINHESTVTLRNVAASAWAATASETNAGSVFIDTFRGFTSISDVVSGGSITRFDDTFLLDAGHVVCKIPASRFSFMGKQVTSFGTGSKLVSTLNIMSADILLSDNEIVKGSFGITDQNPTSPRMGVLSYVGTGAANNDIQIPSQTVKVTIFNRLNNTSLALVLNQIATNNTGTNIAWLNVNLTGANPILRVFSNSPFNTAATNYDVVWEK